MDAEGVQAADAIVREGDPHLAGVTRGHVKMNAKRAARAHEPVYTMAVGAGRAFFGAILRLQPIVSGMENIPATGPAVLAITHFGYMDFALVEWVTWRHNRRRIRFLVTKGAFRNPVVGRLLRAMQHIPVDMASGGGAYSHSIEALRRGELVGIFPEAGVSASFTVRELKSGAVRMAAEAGTPLIPVIVWGGQFLKTKNHRARLGEAYPAPIRVVAGAPMIVTTAQDPTRTTEELRERLRLLLEEAQASYPRSGAGQWWQPAHLGGAAPTPADAALAEAERQRRKSTAHG